MIAIRARYVAIWRKSMVQRKHTHQTMTNTRAGLVTVTDTDESTSTITITSTNADPVEAKKREYAITSSIVRSSIKCKMTECYPYLLPVSVHVAHTALTHMHELLSPMLMSETDRTFLLLLPYLDFLTSC